MWIDLPNLWIIILNVLGIPSAHMLLSWLCTNIPSACFQNRSKSATTNLNPIYERIFFIRKWKHLLPDAAPWFKGFSKGKLTSTDPTYLNQFIVETKRGEFSHWLQWIVISGFILWNPYPANIIILGYAAFSNVPCILNLRYTRKRLTRVTTKKTKRPPNG